MSAIASFYLVRNEDVAGLKDLATRPVGRGRDGKWHDPYAEFLRSSARELETFEWSGDVIASDVCNYLLSRSVDIEEYCDEALSDHFCDMRNGVIYVFQADGGKRLAELIESKWPDETRLSASPKGPETIAAGNEAVPLEAVFDGLRILKTWLSQADEHNVGLLNVEYSREKSATAVTGSLSVPSPQR